MNQNRISKTENNVSIYEKRLEALNRAAIISVGDPAGNILEVNQLFQDISQYSRDELIGKNHRIVNSGFHSKEFFEQMWKTVNSGKVWHGQIKNKKKNGEYYWVDAVHVPIFDDKNKLHEILSFRFDITEFKDSELTFEQEKIKNITETKLAALGEMAASIAHEINNPLAIIKANASSVRKSISNSEIDRDKIQNCLKTIEDTVNRVAKIIKDVRGFSENKLCELFDFAKTSEVIDSAISLASERFDITKVTFKKNIENLEFKCKPTQLKQALYALITNSIEAVESLPEKWIEICATQIGNTLEITITDSGIGISKGVQESMMQPFYTTKSVGKGTGLGLSMVKTIIEEHGGKISYDTSSPNTKFVIHLPMFTEKLSVVNFDDAITAHLDWRQKLEKYLNNCDGSLNPEIVSSDAKCPLGQWLFHQNESKFDHIKSAHAAFHICAGDIVRRIHSGEKIISTKTLGPGTEFDTLSRTIVTRIQQLRAALHQKENL